MKRKVKVKTATTVYTFAYLRAAGWRALEEAKKNEKGRFYQCMISQLFSAFCLEAYLNHIGKEKLPYWEKIERKLGPKEKLEIISHEIGLKINYGKRPFQGFDAIFKLRNLLAHGKTEHTNKVNDQLLEEGEEPAISQANWQKNINIETATKFSEDSKEILEILNSKARFDPSVLHVQETNDWWVLPADIE
ncbi:MAG: hypothetical protein Q8L41_03180 [Anaerolineales bacterium]|nr:hypothetical protein [Anaerolineales bacterium]